MKRVLVTGAGGFVGSHLCPALEASGFQIRAAVRHSNFPAQTNERVLIGDINASTNWAGILTDIDVVIHLAARVHVMHDHATNPLAEFLEVNLHGTVNLARQAAKSGVKRFLYVSSIGVNGLYTSGDTKFSEKDTPSPHNPYAVSKWEAEQALHVVGRETGLEIVVVRPPLVYGAGAPGNFAQMMRIVMHGIPLPLASVHNQRSLIYVGNLVDALIVCAAHPAAAGQTYLICDGENISTPDLIRRISVAMGKPSRLLRLPSSWLHMLGKMTGKSAEIERLLGSLQIDNSKICSELGWQPPFSLSQGLAITAGWYF